MTRQIRIHPAPVLGVGGDDELPPPHAQQVVFPQDPVNPLMVHLPSAPAEFGGDARTAVARHFQRDPLDGIAQVHVRICGLRFRIEAVEAGPAYPAQLRHSLYCHVALGLHFLRDFPTDSGFPVNACSIRCSSMRCKQPFKKSISRACWPILRSSSATRPSSQRRLPPPGKTLPGPCRNSRRQRCSTFGLTSNARATSPSEAPFSIRWIAASLNSFVNCLRDNPMTQFSFGWILSLNRLSHFGGQVQIVFLLPDHNPRTGRCSHPRSGCK